MAQKCGSERSTRKVLLFLTIILTICVISVVRGDPKLLRESGRKKLTDRTAGEESIERQRLAASQEDGHKWFQWSQRRRPSHHHVRRHSSLRKMSDWANLLQKPLSLKYPKLRQLYRRALSGSTSSSPRPPIRSQMAIPNFELSRYQQWCDEDVPVGTSILQVQVFQAEQYNLSYTLSDPVNFTIDQQGVIRSNARLDADYNGASYMFDVTATISGSESSQAAKTSVHINTNNKNDEPPVFSEGIYHSRVDETAQPNAVVTTIIATDKDGDKVKYDWSSESSMPLDMFVLDGNTGVIRLGRNLKFDDDIYHLNVTATDDGSCCEGGGPIHTGTALVVVDIIDVNDNKPIFVECDSYQPKVKENQPPGAYVITVKADDKDRGPNGVVTYGILQSSDQHFRIDERTGVVTTAKVFDREGSDGKLVSITVLAKDQGSTPLDGICSFRVLIEDVNDNSPIFDRKSYHEKLKQQTSAPSDIFRMSATDDDADNNAIIEYSLEADEETSKYFEVDKVSGWVKLKKALGVKSSFTFKAVATDKGEPPLSSKVDVTIEVFDLNVNPPSFPKQLYTVDIPENTKEDTLVLTIDASSGVKDNPRVTFKIVDGSTPQTNKDRTFYLKPKGDNEAEIYVLKPLDYESIKEYNLTVRVENQYTQASETTVFIKLIDVNDEIPQFGANERLFVLEEQPIGTAAGQLHAFDKDSTPPYNTVTFELDGPDDVHSLFKINKDTGELTTMRKFDRESNHSFRIRVKITDGAESARASAKPGEHNSYFQDFYIVIDDINDNEPAFEKSSYKAEVKENEDIGHIIITVQATDKDQSSNLSYQLTDGHVGAFQIQAGTGSIMVAGKIDYETKNKYNLTVVVSDGKFEAVTTVEITVLDLNDNPPKFDKTKYEVTIWERAMDNYTGLPEEIISVSVTDADASRPKDFIFFLTGQANEIGRNGKPSFEIGKQTGVIVVNTPLDRDSPNGRPKWLFNVIARDEGGRSGALDGFAEVVVKLRDINDNDPVFQHGPYVGYVPEDVPKGYEIMTMMAEDYDDPNEGTNAILTYSILQNVEENGKKLFTIDKSSAAIRTNAAPLDREKVDKYVVVVEAKDGGGRKGTGTVTIVITDVNDSPPRFEKSHYNVTIPESMRGSAVLILNVLDDDLPDTNNNFFSIVTNSGFGYDYFKVVNKNKTSAELQVWKPLDYENPDHRKGFSFQVTVNDKGPNAKDPNHIASCFVHITITDINDNAPVFDLEYQNVSIKEDAPMGTSIAKFHATDADNDGNSKISYSIEHSTNRHRQFVIGVDGTVTIQRPLDRELVQRHILHILAKDDGAPPKTSTATLTVNVLDVNDNAPVFKEDYRPVVPENEPPSFLVVEVEAYDPDDYSAGNGPPFHFALANSASSVIKQSFKFEYKKDGGGGEGSFKIFTAVEFDREMQKEYFVPIVIQDSGSPSMSATLTLTIIIGDKNDNPMKDGSTEIFVYNYKGKAPETLIGRVYVEDKDDWDLPDKIFSWRDSEGDKHFKLEENGNIIMLPQTLGGVYVLYFSVVDNARGEHANANATITVKEISETAVYSSGSIRMADISEEEFISNWDDKSNTPTKSKYEKMKEKISTLVDAKMENVDLFTVKKKLGSASVLDIRFSAHGSPFYKPEQINGILSGKRSELETEIGVNITMIGIDECLYENVNCESSCTNFLETTERPYVVFANRSCLAGVNSEVVARCTCRARNFSNLENCGTIKCFNGGTCVTFPNGKARCYCPRGFDGPRCQKTMIGFRKPGYAWFSPFEQCEQSHFSIEFLTEAADGLLFYNGPISDPDPNETIIRDFISLELLDGFPRLLVDFGSGTLELSVKGRELNDREWHRIDVFWRPEEVKLVVDYCQNGTIDDKVHIAGSNPEFDRSSCEANGMTPLFNEYLNVNAPLQIGGVSHKEKLKYGWEYEHSRVGFIGCIKNVLLNSEFYDLASSGYSLNAESGCPLTEDQCHENDIEPFCVNGVCIGSKTSVTCDCYPGFMGERCDLYAPNATMLSESYIKYSLNYQPQEFTSEMMVKFRTSELSGELFHAVGQDPREYLILEIVDGHLVYHFNMGSLSKGSVWLTNASVNDGQWHDVYLSRHGSVASIALDGGEGRRYNETLEYDGLRQLMQINKDNVLVGGGYRDELGNMQNDFKNSCISDVRFDTRLKNLPLPMSSDSKYAVVASYNNVELNCPAFDTCITTICPNGMLCAVFMDFPICICSVIGYVVGPKGVCEDYNECDDFPCKNGGTCENLDPGYRCHCVSPYSSPNCTTVLVEEPLVVLGSGALAAILICALIILILVLVLVVYVRSKRTSYGPVYPDDDIRQNIINYNDEGGGEEDMNKFDISALRIPVDGTGPIPFGPKPGPEKPPKHAPLVSSYPQDSEQPDVGDFINNNLGKANEDPDAVPSDDLRVYAFEGSGSTAGSLSSLASGTDDNEQDFDYLNNWGPRFQKLADMYGHGESEEE